MAQYFLKDIIRYNSSTRGWGANDYTVTPSSLTVNEGVACMFTVKAFGFKQGSELGWSVVDSTGLTPGRFDNTSGTVILNENSVGTFTITISADQRTAVNTQQYTVGIFYGIDTLIATANVVVNDSSKRSPGLLVDWYGTTSVIVPTTSVGSSYVQDGDATVLDPGAFVDIGQALQSNQFTITIDADLGRNWNGNTWDVIWANEAYDSSTGVFAYFNGSGISYGEPNSEQEAYMGDNDIYYAGRTLYTFVFDGITQKIYIDDTGPIANDGIINPSDFSIPANTFYIGSRHDNTGSAGPSDSNGGTYYSVKVEATVKTDQQVLDYFNDWWSEVSITTPIIDINCQAPGSLVDPGGTIVFDTSGDYLNAMLFSGNNSVTINNSQLPYSIDVQSYGNNYVYLGQDWLPWTAGEAFTIHLWFRTDLNAYGPLFMQTNSSDPFNSDSYVPAIYIDTGGFLHTSTFYHPPANPTVTTAQVNTGEWFLVSVAYENGDQKTYINGVINGSGLGGVTQSSYASNYHYFLAGGNTTGWPSDPNNSVLGCSIGQFKAYGYSQTPAEILAFYNSTRLPYRTLTVQIDDYVTNPKALLAFGYNNGDLSVIQAGWTVTGPNGYSATVVSSLTANNSDYTIQVSVTPADTGTYTFVSNI